MSVVKRCVPVTMSRAAVFGTEVPAMVHFPAGVTAAPSTVFRSCWPCVNSPNPADWLLPACLALPSATVIDARSTFHFSAARSISVSRAAAATCFSCGAMVGVVRLPNVPMSKGVRSVSAITSLTDAMGVRNSSATACASEVRMFCPTSVLPVKTVMAPSSPMCSQAPMVCGIASPARPRARPDSCAAAGSSKASRSTKPPPSSLKKSRRSNSNRYAGPSKSS